MLYAEPQQTVRSLLEKVISYSCRRYCDVNIGLENTPFENEPVPSNTGISLLVISVITIFPSKLDNNWVSLALAPPSRPDTVGNSCQ